jgi:hypothetical protein
LLPPAAVAARRRRGIAGASAVPCARIHRGSATVSVCLAAAAPAPRARTDAALRGSCVECRATLRLRLRALPARYSLPHRFTSELITPPSLRMRLRCGLYLSPARFCCLQCAHGAALR